MKRLALCPAFWLVASCDVWISDSQCLNDADCPAEQQCAPGGVCSVPDETPTETTPPACSVAPDCVAPDIQIESVTAFADELVVVGRVVAPGTRDLVAAGACATPVGPGEAVCADGTVENLVTSGLALVSLSADTEYVVSVWASTEVERTFAPPQRIATRPMSPGNLLASDGVDADAVRVSWSRVAGATAYLVLRDDVEIARVSVPEFVDSDAAAGGPPSAPVMEASDGTNALAIEVSWSAGELVSGEAHTYSVATVGAHGVSEPCPNDTGFRAGEPPTRFEIRRGSDGAWTERTGRVWSDPDVPIRTHVWTPPTASRGEKIGAIDLTIDLPTLNAPELTRYEVRAQNRYGTGRTSSDTGFRGVGPLLTELQAVPHEWNGDVQFTGLIGDPPLLPEPDIAYRPADNARTYTFRYRAQQLGARASVSPAAIGYAAECAEDVPCETGEECVRGVCTLPGFLPFFKGIGPRGAPPGELYSDADETFGTM